LTLDSTLFVIIAIILDLL